LPDLLSPIKQLPEENGHMFLNHIGQLFIFSLNNGNGNCKKAMLLVIIINNMSFAPYNADKYKTGEGT
jgi:hypothetical protein